MVLERGGEERGEACETTISRGWIRRERETRDEMEFLSVGLDKQPQFRSRDRSQPKRRRRLRLRRDARFSTPRANLFFPPSRRYFRSSSLFRLERNFSSAVLRALSRYIASFITIDSTDSPFHLPYFLRCR